MNQFRSGLMVNTIVPSTLQVSKNKHISVGITLASINIPWEFRNILLGLPKLLLLIKIVGIFEENREQGKVVKSFYRKTTDDYSKINAICYSNSKYRNPRSTSKRSVDRGEGSSWDNLQVCFIDDSWMAIRGIS